MKVLLAILCTLLQSSYGSIKPKLPPIGEHVCKDLISVSYTAVRSISEPELYRYCCKRFIFCMKWCLSTRYNTVTKTVLLYTQKPVLKCCPGWKQSGTSCLPVCDKLCVNGNCTAPNHCDCLDGYTGQQCAIDIDECANSIHNCEHQCKNEAGSYTCSCKDGYKLSEINNKTCSLIETPLPLPSAAKHSNRQPTNETNYSWIIVPVGCCILLLIAVIVYRKRKISIYDDVKTKLSKPSTTTVQYSSFKEDAELPVI